MVAEQADDKDITPAPVSTTDVPITQPQSAIPAEWLDRLLVATCDLPADATVREVAAALISAAHSAVPDLAVGVCIPGSGDQVVVRQPDRISYSQAPNPALLFPEFEHERVSPLGDIEGATLHVAVSNPSATPESRQRERFLERLNQALTAAVRRVRAYQRLTETHEEIQGLQAQVIQSEKLASLGQIAAGIVHELNNPLTSIVAYSDYLRKRWESGGGDTVDLERLQRINEAAERILTFSRDLVAYARPSREVPAPVNVHDVIERALVFCEHVIEGNGVSVERDFGEISAAVGVGGQLTQVFVNLFTNACHAMADGGGVLTVSTRVEHTDKDLRRIVVKVSDQGHGIDPEQLKKIFDPFFTTKTEGMGTGLGLSIVKKIVARHGGEILAETGDDRGLVFSVRLPVAAGADL